MCLMLKQAHYQIVPFRFESSRISPESLLTMSHHLTIRFVLRFVSVKVSLSFSGLCLNFIPYSLLGFLALLYQIFDVYGVIHGLSVS